MFSCLRVSTPSAATHCKTEAPPELMRPARREVRPFKLYCRLFAPGSGLRAQLKASRAATRAVSPLAEPSIHLKTSAVLLDGERRARVVDEEALLRCAAETPGLPHPAPGDTVATTQADIARAYLSSAV